MDQQVPTSTGVLKMMAGVGGEGRVTSAIQHSMRQRLP